MRSRGNVSGPGALDLPVRIRLCGRELRLRLREKLEFDSPGILGVLGRLGGLAGAGLFRLGKRRAGFQLLAGVHRANCSPWTTAFVERWVGSSVRKDALREVYQSHSGLLSPTGQTRRFFEQPGRLLGPLVMVLKSSRPGEKGIIAINYSFVFPLFARLFDVARVARRYHLVLEPSWSGYCTPDILCYTLLDEPVFIQAYEPRDRDFLERLGSNLVPVPVSTNWWVDHRLFRPRAEVERDLDIVMVASWADFKRHGRFFAAVSRLRRRRSGLKVVLVGYPAGRTKEDIRALAIHHGVSDLVEIHEWLPPEEVAAILGRAKVNVVWSRREGVNRAIVEGMFAGVPCVVRAGFNYGYAYPYINEATGCFASESELPDRLTWMMENRSRFSPREWVMRHMSAQRATELLGESIRKVAVARGEPWSTDPVVKVGRLHDMVYWDPADRERFEADYAFLRTTLRGGREA
jgi:glycosyltransferase involved in cell wall biosynthesis